MRPHEQKLVLSLMIDLSKLAPRWKKCCRMRHLLSGKGSVPEDLLGIVVWERHPRAINWSVKTEPRQSGEILLGTKTIQETVAEAMAIVEERLKEGNWSKPGDTRAKALEWWKALSLTESTYWVSRVWPYGPYFHDNVGERPALIEKVHQYAQKRPKSLDLRSTVKLICGSPLEDGLHHKVLVSILNTSDKHATLQFPGLVIELHPNGTWEAFGTGKG